MSTITPRKRSHDGLLKSLGDGIAKLCTPKKKLRNENPVTPSQKDEMQIEILEQTPKKEFTRERNSVHLNKESMDEVLQFRELENVETIPTTPVLMTPKRVLVTREPSTESREETFENLNELSEQLRFSVNNKAYADLIIRVGPSLQPIYAHRVILANRSPYFNQLFTQQGNILEQKILKIDKPDLIPEVFLKVLEYCYTGVIRLKLDDVLEILAMSDQFGIRSLKEMCSKFIQENIDPENACMLLEFSREFNAQSLTQFTLTFIDQNIHEVLQSKSILELSEETLITIIKRNQLQLKNVEEILIFHAVHAWAKQKAKGDSPEALQQVAKNVLPHIRYPLMTSEQLSSIVEPSNFVPQTLLFEAYKHLLVPQKSDKAPRFISRNGEKPSSLRKPLSPVNANKKIKVNRRDSCFHLIRDESPVKSNSPIQQRVFESLNDENIVM